MHPQRLHFRLGYRRLQQMSLSHGQEKVWIIYKRITPFDSIRDLRVTRQQNNLKSSIWEEELSPPRRDKTTNHLCQQTKVQVEVVDMKTSANILTKWQRMVNVSLWEAGQPRHKGKLHLRVSSSLQPPMDAVRMLGKKIYLSSTGENEVSYGCYRVGSRVCPFHTPFSLTRQKL